nr:hypothetical protein [Tanacetum cinerariifolium]
MYFNCLMRRVTFRRVKSAALRFSDQGWRDSSDVTNKKCKGHPSRPKIRLHFSFHAMALESDEGCRVRTNLLQPKGFVNHVTVGERRPDAGAEHSIFAENVSNYCVLKAGRQRSKTSTMEAISNKFEVLKVKYEKARLGRRP